MNAVRKADGRSARRRTVQNLRNTFLNVHRLRDRGIFWGIVVLMLALTSCHKDTRGQDSSLSKKQPTVSDSLSKPKVNIQVNRRYDDKGNLVGFDSTYSSYYSHVKGDTSAMDTLFKRFDSYFDRGHSSRFRREFDNLFFKDSLWYPDFFHRDFFLKRYELNDAYLRNMMKRMDSVKNEFYREQSGRKGKGEAKDI